MTNSRTLGIPWTAGAAQHKVRASTWSEDPSVPVTSLRSLTLRAVGVSSPVPPFSLLQYTHPYLSSESFSPGPFPFLLSVQDQLFKASWDQKFVTQYKPDLWLDQLLL